MIRLFNCFIVYFFVMIAFSIWPIDIYWYGIFYLVWFLLWYIFLKLIWKSGLFAKYERLQNLLYKNTDDILIAIVLWVLLWWRLWEVFIYQWEYYSHNLFQIFAVWNWGMSFIGGIVGVLISLIILKKIKKFSAIEFWLLIDCVVAIVPLAILFWRFWNYLNQELYWLIVPENFWWLGNWVISVLTNLNIFHVYKAVDTNIRVNTNFLSMVFEGGVLFIITINVLLARVKRKIAKPWFIVWLFLIFYSLFRFFLEYLRVDSQSQFAWIFTRSQWVFILFAFVGLWFILNKRFKFLGLSLKKKNLT